MEIESSEPEMEYCPCLGIVGDGVQEEDVTGDVHVAGEAVPDDDDDDLDHDDVPELPDVVDEGLLGDPGPGPHHHARVDQVITELSVIRTLEVTITIM